MEIGEFDAVRAQDMNPDFNMQTEITIKSPCKVARLGNQWVDSGPADESVRWRRSFRQVDSKDRCCSSESE